jgi:signal transduction histidine kinase
MKQNRKRTKKVGIFGQLVIGYIVFAVLIVVSIIACVLVTILEVSGGNVNSIVPYELVDDEGRVQDLSSFGKIGGWIEKLDTNYQVIQIFGEKKDKPMSYTQEEIYKYMQVDNYVDSKDPLTKYRGFMKIVERDGNTYYYLIKTERKAYQVTYNIILSKDTLSNWYIGGIALFIFFFIANCSLLSFYLSRKIKKPLKVLTDGMEKVKNGEGKVRINLKAQVEFEEIKDTFNLMMTRLENEKSEKEENERKKKIMLLNLSHDIKTPVSTIKSYANALEAGLVQDEKKNIYYKTIDAKANRVSSLIEDMFTMLKMDSVDYALNVQPENICELVREICVEYYEEINRNGIKFHIDIPEEQLIADVDKRLFQRVIANLISNGFKFNQDGTGIWISINKNEKQQIVILVEDDGTLLDKGIRDSLFEPFVRGDTSRKTDGGTGLGLAISKAIIEKHKGTIQYITKEERNCFQVIIQEFKYEMSVEEMF